MNRDNKFVPFVFFSSTGCLLPSLIIFNLFFGWIFLKPLYWVAIEAILLLLFVINGYVMTRKIISASGKKRDNVIDVEAEVIREKRRSIEGHI